MEMRRLKKNYGAADEADGAKECLQMQPIYGQFRQRPSTSSEVPETEGICYGQVGARSGRNAGDRQQQLRNTRRQQLISIGQMAQSVARLLHQIWHILGIFSKRCCTFHWLSLAILAMFLLFLLLLGALSLLYLWTSHSSPNAYFLVILLFTVLILSTTSAFHAVLRVEHALRLRLLLLLTCLFPLFGLPYFCLPAPLCFRLDLHKFFGIAFCHPHPFPLDVLSLLLTALIALRPLLQHWLLQIRQNVLLRSLCAHPLCAATFLNHFCARMEAIADSREEHLLMDHFGQQLRTALEQQLASAKNDEKLPLIEIGTEMESGRKKRRPILRAQKYAGSRWKRKKRQARQSVQFSQLLLLREVSCVQNEVGQLVEMDKHKKFVLESLYADFVRDFRLRMTSRGQLHPNSAHQIFTRFGPVQTMHYTKMTTSDGYYGHQGTDWGDLVRKERKHQMEADDVENTVARRQKPERDYATIDSAGEASGADNLLRAAAAKAISQPQRHHHRQLPPQVPSTPIPQTTPTDPQGPQLIAEPGNRLLPTVVSAFYENLSPVRPQWPTLEKLAEEEVGSKQEEMELEDEEEEMKQEEEAKEEKREEPKQHAAERCSCPMGADCLVMSAQASAHYYFLRPSPDSEQLLEAFPKGDDGECGKEEREHECFYGRR